MFGLYKKFGLSCFVYQLTPFTDRVRLCAMPPICSVYRVPTGRLRLYLFLNLRVGLRQIVEQIINQQEAKLQEDSSYTVRQTETTSGGGYRTCYADENLRKKKKKNQERIPLPLRLYIHTTLTLEKWPCFAAFSPWCSKPVVMCFSFIPRCSRLMYFRS